MLSTTLSRLQCPVCAGNLEVSGTLSSDQVVEIRRGTILCLRCGAHFPILAGVAVLVEDVGNYILEHVKGISRLVPDSDIPKAFLSDYRAVKAELAAEHIEEDLEAERVIALYFMNHYLSVKGSPTEWWKPRGGAPGSPLIESLIVEHWDNGPLARIRDWVKELAAKASLESTIELGCGVAGLCEMLAPHTRHYLGIDSSFASIALGRHLALGVEYPFPVQIPGDLLEGTVSREIPLKPRKRLDGSADLVVGHIDALPAAREAFDLALALNAIDMLDEPEALPRIQHELLKAGGVAIQSCPYIWHANVAAHLRELLPEGVDDSSAAVEWLYTEQGFDVFRRETHIPWLFFKHLRQLEIYSVHALAGRKST